MTVMLVRNLFLLLCKDCKALSGINARAVQKADL